MPQDMNLSINGQSQVPPGFRFHPTEEELLHYYLRKKVAQEKIDLDVIREVDLNKLEPWDIQEKCRIGSTPQSDWYFFSHKDKKYPTGTRTNRATAAGFWKATGRDKIIYSSFRRIGLRKTLVFYKGRAPHGQKSDWIMHEYRLDENPSTDPTSAMDPSADQSGSEEGWVVCRVFRKKNFHKTLDHHHSPKSSSSTSMDSSKLVHAINPPNHNYLISHNNMVRDNNHHPSHNTVLDQILLYMGRNNNNDNNTCKIGLIGQPQLVNPSDGCDDRLINHPPQPDLHDQRFMHLPRLECPTTTTTTDVPSIFHHHHHQPLDIGLTDRDDQDQTAQVAPLTVGDWASFDRLVASQLNGQAETPSGSAFGIRLADEEEEEEDGEVGPALLMPRLRIDREYNGNENSDDFWGFTKSSSPPPSDPLRHLSI